MQEKIDQATLALIEHIKTFGKKVRKPRKKKDGKSSTN
jgi:hypothetical protein